jgi:hypothetical protein
MLRFTGTLEAVDRGGARIELPFDVREAFGEANKPETRLKRAARAVEMLGEGGKHP